MGIKKQTSSNKVQYKKLKKGLRNKQFFKDKRKQNTQ